jgi:hypothetical protein
MVASYSPARPSTERDTLHLIDGAPSYLGCLVSSGSVVDNGSTANKFNYIQPGNSLAGTLAGKVLMFQADAAGYLLPSALALGPVGVVTLVAQSSTVVPGTTACGPSVLAAERVLIIMQPTTGWVQWLPSSGSGNCYVWELL